MFYVMSNSMESVYPVGSVVIVKETPEDMLSEGDDITFYDYAITKSMVTHRIEEIKSYEDGVEKVFVTKGVDNQYHDKNPVPYSNVVGKVVFSVPFVGFILSYFQANILKVILFCFIIDWMLSYIANEE